MGSSLQLTINIINVIFRKLLFVWFNFGYKLMSRPLRIEYPGAWYHVMNRGANYQNIFSDDGDRNIFLQLVGETCEIWKIKIHAYCLMDNHYHFLIETPEGGLGRVMRHLNGVYTQRFNRKNSSDGPLFRGRYKAILVDGDTYLMEIVRYIHMNPAKKRNDINVLMNYPWSSNKFYLDKRKKPVWLTTSNILSLFSTNIRNQKSLYKEFITDKIPEDIRKFYSQKRLLPVLGDNFFKEWVKKTFVKDNVENYEIAEANKKAAGPTVESVLEKVKECYKVDNTELKRKRRGVENEPRNVAIYLCRHLCGLSLNEIKLLFGIDTYTTVSMASINIKNRISVDRGFQKKLERIKILINDS